MMVTFSAIPRFLIPGLSLDNAVVNTIPAASELRKVSGFDPLKFLKQTVSARTGQKVLKLELPYKQLWFRLACPNGRMLVKPLRVTDQIAIFEAMVYASKDDPEPLAQFTSSVTAQEAPDGKFVQAAQDSALNEALENAGFGVQLCDLVEPAMNKGYSSEIPVSKVMEARQATPQAVPSTTQKATPTADKKTVSTVTQPIPASHAVEPTREAFETPSQFAVAPMQVPDPTPAPSVSSHEETSVEQAVSAPGSMDALLGTTPNKTVEVDFSNMQARTTEPVSPVEEPTVSAEAAPAPSYTPDMSVEDICQRMTLDEARSYVVGSGVCKGWTLAQVAARRAASLRFYVYSDNSDNVLKAAAKRPSQPQRKDLFLSGRGAGNQGLGKGGQCRDFALRWLSAQNWKLPFLW